MSFYDADLFGGNSVSIYARTSAGCPWVMYSHYQAWLICNTKKTHYSGTSPAASQYILNFLLRRTSKLELTLKHEMWIATYFNLGCNSDGCTTSRNQWRLCCACPQWVLSRAIVLWSFWLLHWCDGALSRYKHWLRREVFLCSQPHHFGPKCCWFCDYNK